MSIQRLPTLVAALAVVALGMPCKHRVAEGDTCGTDVDLSGIDSGEVYLLQTDLKLAETSHHTSLESEATEDKPTHIKGVNNKGKELRFPIDDPADADAAADAAAPPVPIDSADAYKRASEKGAQTDDFPIDDPADAAADAAAPSDATGKVEGKGEDAVPTDHTAPAVPSDSQGKSEGKGENSPAPKGGAKADAAAPPDAEGQSSTLRFSFGTLCSLLLLAL